MVPRQVANRWSALEAQAHLPEIQETIKREIEGKLIVPMEANRPQLPALH